MTTEIDQHETWRKQRDKLKKVQLQFEFIQEVDRQIKLDAIAKGTTPSNIVRDVLGFKPAGPKRPRVGISLDAEEIRKLALRFSLDPDDRRALVRRATEAVHAYYRRKAETDN